MIIANISYIGNKSGMMARFYSTPQFFGKFETEKELNKKFEEWVRLSKSNDWKLEIK